MLDYLIAQNSSPTWDEYLGYGVDYVANALNKFTDFEKSQIRIWLGQVWNIAFFDSTIGYSLKEQMLMKGSFTGEQLYYFNQIVNPPEPVTSLYYGELSSDILASKLMSDEQASLLAMCSIGESSYISWTAAKTDPSNPWYDPAINCTTNLDV